MLTYELNARGTKPLYISLYEKIKTDIEYGNIQANEKLPSKRALAEHLMVSVITVQNAYALLISEGYVYAKEKVGYFACEIFANAKIPLPSQNASINYEITGEKELYTINLCENTTLSNKHFPFSVWSKQMRQVITENYDHLLAKIPHMGLWSLRRAISEYLYRFRGMRVDPNAIIIGAGTEYLYSIVVKLIGRERVFAVEDPGYRRIAQIYAAEGLQVAHVPIDEYGLAIKSPMTHNANVVHISPSHHFPTGIFMPVKRRMEILHWAQEKPNRYIIEDDYDSEFRFASKPLPTMQSIDNGQRTIYINTFSKTISPSLRISYMILPKVLLKKYNEQFSFYSCTVSSFEQYTLAKFISEGYYERHISRMRKHYRIREMASLPSSKTAQSPIKSK